MGLLKPYGTHRNGMQELWKKPRKTTVLSNGCCLLLVVGCLAFVGWSGCGFLVGFAMGVLGVIRFY